MKFEHATRWGYTHKFRIHAPGKSFTGYITANKDGDAFELFVHFDQADESMRGMARCLCLIISKAVQRGTDLADVCAALRGQRFEPAGITEHPVIHFTSSLADYIAAWLQLTFSGPGLAYTPRPNVDNPVSGDRTNDKGEQYGKQD